MHEVGDELLVEKFHVFDLFQIVFRLFRQLVDCLFFSRYLFRGIILGCNFSLNDTSLAFLVLVQHYDIICHNLSQSV